jgi:hypothetical protein
MYANELYHFGVKGMKWGIRRYQNKNGTLTSAGKQRYPVVKSGPYEQNRRINERLLDNKISSGHPTKIGDVVRKVNDFTKPKVMSNKSNTSIKDMSDAELRQKINRLQMEKQYEKLNEKKVSAGKKFVTGILVGAATSVASSYANKYMGKAAEWMGGKVVKGAGKGLDIVVDNIPMNIILDDLTN